MEPSKWKKDKTPYYIFACEKCGRALYVKTAQKSKKCLSCKHIHYVAKLQTPIEIVYGMNSAINAVKQKQHNLAAQETGYIPDLMSNEEFRVRVQSNKSENVSKALLETDHSEYEYAKKFILLLKDLFSKFKRFPRYMILMKSSEYNIPQSEIHFLLSRFNHEGLLISLPNDYYTLDLKNKKDHRSDRDFFK